MRLGPIVNQCIAFGHAYHPDGAFHPKLYFIRKDADGEHVLDDRGRKWLFSVRDDGAHVLDLAPGESTEEGNEEYLDALEYIGIMPGLDPRMWTVENVIGAAKVVREIRGESA